MIEDNRYYWSHLKTKNVTIRVMPRKKEHGLIFRVGSMIDLGGGRQTVMLQNVAHPLTYGWKRESQDIAVPFRMGNLDFIYTSPDQPKFHNVHNLLSTLYKGNRVERIVADVLSPGDLLIFMQEGHSMKIKMVEAMRVVEKDSYKKSPDKKSNGGENAL